VETFQIIHFLHEIVLFHCKNYLRNIPLLILTLAPYKYNGILCDSTRKSQNSKKKKKKKNYMMAWYKKIHIHAYKHTGDLYYFSFFLFFLFYFSLNLSYYYFEIDIESLSYARTFTYIRNVTHIFNYLLLNTYF
jgi:hypothetical protein